MLANTPVSGFVIALTLPFFSLRAEQLGFLRRNIPELRFIYDNYIREFFRMDWMDNNPSRVIRRTINIVHEN